MEPSRKRTLMTYRSKAVCAIALVVGFGCAVIGVGGATAGNGAYLRHLREARLEAKLAGLALAHRSPEQLVLAIRPKLKAHIEDTTASVPPAATTPVAVTTTTTAPATTTTTTTDTTSIAAATSTPSTPATTTTDASTTTTTATTTTPTTTDTTTATDTTPTDTTPTDTTPTDTTSTDTTATGTTTTDTTSTDTTTTDTTTTDTTTTGTPDATSLPFGHGRQPGTTGSGSTTYSCHGRCDSLTGTSGVVPASLPSSASSAASTNFTLSSGSVTAPLLSTPVNASSTGTLSPISSTTTPSTTPTQTPTTPTPTPISLAGGLQSIVKSSSSAISDLTHGSGSRHSTATLPTATSGTGTTVTGGTASTDPAGAAAAGTTHTSAHHAAKTHPSSGGAGLTAPIDHYITQFVNVIPTAVWLALGAAFALMLAFAALAFRSGRRARRREMEFAAISAAALTDALTGILNRRGFTEAAERELARASRYNRPFVLAYVDVRGLKTVNDTEGHLMGDELIKTVAGLMKESARADDVVGRIGGDEFALLLGEQTAESAGPVVRRIQAHVAEARDEMEISVPWELTIGMASFPDDGATLEELLDVADRRLYEQRGIALR
jgi:diguanylate cyclase (GGDEF)-like protein